MKNTNAVSNVEAREKIAVVYARYSCDKQNVTSIEAQLKEIYAYCEREGYTVLEKYIDEAISGTTDKRPGFRRMIEDSYNKNFSAVIVYQFDRFSRKQYDNVVYKKQLSDNGVRVLSVREQVADDAGGFLTEGIFEMLAQHYSIELGQKIRRNLELNADKCMSTGGLIPLGYFIGEDKKYHINKETEIIVKYAFEKYADGQTVTEIIEYLNKQGYKTTKGGQFNKNSLRTMLTNVNYIGVYTRRGRYTHDGMPRIVSDELFERVAKILEKNKNAPARARAKEEYLLTTKLFCGDCKKMMIGYSGTSKTQKVYHYYACKGKITKICGKKMVDKVQIENLVIQRCRDVLIDENIEKVAKEIIAIIENKSESINVKRLENLLIKKMQQHENVIDAISDCGDKDLRQSLFVKASRLESERKNIEKEIIIEKKTYSTLTLSNIIAFLKQLREGDVDNLEYKKAIINVIINSIYLYEDKMTIVFNIGDSPVTIGGGLLSAMENNVIIETEESFYVRFNSGSKQRVKKSLFITPSGP